LNDSTIDQRHVGHLGIGALPFHHSTRDPGPGEYLLHGSLIPMPFAYADCQTVATVLPVILQAAIISLLPENLPVTRLQHNLDSPPNPHYPDKGYPSHPVRCSEFSFKSFRTDIRCTLRVEYGRYERCENKDDLELQAASCKHYI
jgi:hypothetical protein